MSKLTAVALVGMVLLLSMVIDATFSKKALPKGETGMQQRQPGALQPTFSGQVTIPPGFSPKLCLSKHIEREWTRKRSRERVTFVVSLIFDEGQFVDGQGLPLNLNPKADAIMMLSGLQLEILAWIPCYNALTVSNPHGKTATAVVIQSDCNTTSSSCLLGSHSPFISSIYSTSSSSSSTSSSSSSSSSTSSSSTLKSSVKFLNSFRSLTTSLQQPLEKDLSPKMGRGVAEPASTRLSVSNLRRSSAKFKEQYLNQVCAVAISKRLSKLLAIKEGEVIAVQQLEFVETKKLPSVHAHELRLLTAESREYMASCRLPPPSPSYLLGHKPRLPAHLRDRAPAQLPVSLLVAAINFSDVSSVLVSPESMALLAFPVSGKFPSFRIMATPFHAAELPMLPSGSSSFSCFTNAVSAVGTEETFPYHPQVLQLRKEVEEQRKQLMTASSASNLAVSGDLRSFAFPCPSLSLLATTKPQQTRRSLLRQQQKQQQEELEEEKSAPPSYGTLGLVSAHADFGPMYTLEDVEGRLSLVVLGHCLAEFLGVSIGDTITLTNTLDLTHISRQQDLELQRQQARSAEQQRYAQIQEQFLRYQHHQELWKNHDPDAWKDVYDH